jgi:HTH-type transcriptional regulator / antitoxin HipB
MLPIIYKSNYCYGGNMNQKLKDIVKEHRKFSGLTQAQVAKLAGVGKTVVYDIEHGKESIQYDTLMKILRVLNVSISFQSPLSSSIKNQPG